MEVDCCIVIYSVKIRHWNEGGDHGVKKIIRSFYREMFFVFGIGDAVFGDGGL